MSVLKEKHDDVEAVPLKDDRASKIENITFYERVLNFKSNVTVEPVLFGGILATKLSQIATQNLNLDKACRVSKNYGDEICDALIDRKINSTEYEVEIQNIISAIEAWRTVIHTVIPIILLIFMGAWSDRTGNRKTCLLLPIFGQILVNISNILSTVFFHAVSVEVTMVMESLLPAITGSTLMVLLGAFSYVCDITSLETRTFRLGLVTLCMTTGMPVGMSLCGVLLKFTGYYGVFSVAAFINLISFIYGFYTLSSNTAKSEKKSFTILDLLAIQKETAAMVFKKRVGNNRIKIIFILLICALVFAYDHGEHIISYLFLRYQLNWDAYKYSMYLTHNAIVTTFGSLFAITLFSKYWGWHDSSLCILAAISKLAASAYVVFVRTDFQMFMLPFVQSIHDTIYTGIRSIASKLVPVKELGKINSLIISMEIAGSLIFNPVYSSLYAATVRQFTAAAFVLTGVMTLPVLALFLWFFKQDREESKSKQDDIQEMAVHAH